MLLLGFILVIGGLWMVWTDQTVEGLADTSKVVMISLGSNNTYYADIALTNTPNWMAVGGTYKQISGSMGRVIAVDSANIAYYGTKYGVAGSAYNYLKIPGSVIQVSFDYPMVVGLTTSKTVVYIDNVPGNPESAVWTAPQGAGASRAFNSIATFQGEAIGAGTDNQIWYCPDIHVPVWENISTGVLAGISVKNVAYEAGDVVVVDTNNTVYFGRLSLTTRPAWKRLGSRQMTQVSIRNHMGVGVGTDGATYFAADVGGDSWAAISGPPGGSKWVDLYYPTADTMVSFRPATVTSKGYACNADEILQNGVCVSKCPNGTAPDGELCIPDMPIVSIPADIKCTSSPFQTSKKWLCDSPDDYNALITNPTKYTTYVSPTDQVCVTEDVSTKMYYCVTGAEAKNYINPITSLGDDYTTSCATMTKRYVDLSNNLTNLIKIQTGMQDGSRKLGTASTNLTSIYNQMGCSGASGTKATLCSQIQAAASSVGNNASDVSTTLNSVIPSLQTALDTRSSLLGFKTKFQCP